MFPLLQLFFQGFLQRSIVVTSNMFQSLLCAKLLLKFVLKQRFDTWERWIKVNAFIGKLGKFFWLIRLGFLSDNGYRKLRHSARGSRLAFGWSVAESNEKVSPARNNYAHSRCASRYNDIRLDDTFLRPFHCSWFNKSRRYNYADNLSSRVHGDCSNHSWYLAGCCLASENEYEDLFR